MLKLFYLFYKCLNLIKGNKAFKSFCFLSASITYANLLIHLSQLASF